MKIRQILLVGGMILTTVFATVSYTPVEAKQARTDQIRISYEDPKNPAYQQAYEILKERRLLERLKEFLSPFLLPVTLDVTLTECDGEADAMYSDDEITICYEYIELLRKGMPENTTASGIEPIDTLVGPFLDTFLHEFAHALFDIIGIPVLGREEDAADQVAAFIYLHLGKGEARRLIMGTAYAYWSEIQGADAPTMEEYADEQSVPEQRVFNLICIAYGAYPKLFGDIPPKIEMPQERVDICEEEYELFSLAYEKLIEPHVDPKLAKEVFDKSWLPKEISGMMSN